MPLFRKLLVLMVGHFSNTKRHVPRHRRPRIVNAPSARKCLLMPNDFAKSLLLNSQGIFWRKDQEKSGEFHPRRFYFVYCVINSIHRVDHRTVDCLPTENFFTKASAIFVLIVRSRQISSTKCKLPNGTKITERNEIYPLHLIAFRRTQAWTKIDRNISDARKMNDIQCTRVHQKLKKKKRKWNYIIKDSLAKSSGCNVVPKSSSYYSRNKWSVLESVNHTLLLSSFWYKESDVITWLCNITYAQDDTTQNKWWRC